MSGNWDKIVKGATKSKHAPPKAKYIDPLVQGTFEGDYAVSDIAQAIAPRLRDSNSTVVFKALIVVHTILRSGNIKYTYGVWSSKPHLLGLNSVTSGHDSVQNLTKYAYYLHTRLKTYASLGRDSIRDRGERRAEGRGDGGERLRGLTVEKGLLREVATLQKLMDSLLECRFYLEDKEDEVTMTALRLLVKDLLILFTSVNEGVINVLEHYFEMAQVDATTALKIYKSFCKQTEKVVTYLGVAKKMQHILNVQIPNLKHAPVSLAGSLEEYLKDPNFENNRLEYKRNREIAEGKPSKPDSPVNDKSAKSNTNGTSSSSKSSQQPSKSTSASATASASTSKPSADGNKAFVDFFEAIEQEQTSMFDPQTGSPNTAYFQQQAAFNPFLQQPAPAGMGMPMNMNMNMMNTGMGGMALQPQMTGALAFGGGLQPQMTGAFGAPPGGGMNAFGQPTAATMAMQPQLTGFLQPQTTGFNPFRQSMLSPQMTGMNPFGPTQPFGGLPAHQQQQHLQIPQGGMGQQQQQTGGAGPQSAVTQLQPQWTGLNAFQRPSSAPIGAAGMPSSSSSSSNLNPGMNNSRSISGGLGTISEQPQQQSSPHPLAPQPTGSKNPFAIPAGTSTATSPPKPPQPSLNQIAFQSFQTQEQQQQLQQQQTGQPQQQQQQQQNGFGNNAFGNAFGGSSSNNNTNNNNNNAQQQNNTGFNDFFGTGGNSNQGSATGAQMQTPIKTGLMGSIASEFAFGRALPSESNNNNQNSNQSNSNGNNNNNAGMPFNTGGNLPSFATGSTNVTSPSSTTAPSSFNFSSSNNNTNTNTNTGNSSMFSSSAFGSGSGSGNQQPQQQQQLSTGISALQPQATGFGGSNIKPFQPTSSFGASLYADQQNKGSNNNNQGQNNQQQQPQPQNNSNNFGAGGGGGSSGMFGNTNNFGSGSGNTNSNNNGVDLLGGGGGGQSNGNNAFSSNNNAFGGNGNSSNQMNGTPSRSNTFDLLGGGGSNNNNNTGGIGGSASFFGGSNNNNGSTITNGGMSALQPQNTGTFNPFRASMLPLSTGNNNNAFNAFGNNNAGMFGSTMGGAPQGQQGQQQQQGSSSQWGSLI